jgi:aspartate aminotransferase
VRTVPVTLSAEDGYHLPPRAAIENVITDRTRAVILCSPNNPTGTVYSDAELEMIGDICREHGLFLVSDEVYREFTYDGLSHRSALTLPGLDQQVIIADSLSKRVSMCGARVGWIVTHNQELLQNILKFGQARLCPPTLGQYIGAGMNDIPSSYMTETIAEYEARRNLVYEALVEMPGVSVRRPEGAFYMCPQLPVDDADRFATYMLSEFSLDNETVMVAPAGGFYATPGLGKQEIRIAYVLCQEELKRAMAVLRAALKAYPGSTTG